MTQFPSAPPEPPTPVHLSEVPPPLKSKTLSVLAVIFGGTAFLLGLIPLAGVVLALLFGVAAIVLGIIGAVKSHRIMAIIGLALAVVGVVVSFVVASATVEAVESSLEDGAAPGENSRAGGANGGSETESDSDPAAGDQPDAPFPAGTEVATGDWNVSFSNIVPDATDAVLEENMFNEEPKDGFQFFMYQVNATYTGDKSADLWLDLGFGIYLDQTVFTDSCGVIPNDVFDAPEVYKDGAVTANICVAVPTDGVSEALITVEETWSFDGTRYFIETS